ncbi:hypothetical protein MCEMKE14_00569 [Candidatus Nanopelagicaceae bacterium]
MKRRFSVIVTVLALSISLLPNAIAAPDYSSTDLPTVESVDIKITTDTGAVRLITEIAVRWKVNKVIELSGYLGIEGYVWNPLSEPCDSILYGSQSVSGGNSRQILPSEIIEKSKVGDFNIWKLRFLTDLVDGVSLNKRKFCRGEYSIGGLNLKDEADRTKNINTINHGTSRLLLQSASLWSTTSTPFPCPEAYSGSSPWRTVCDSVNLSGIRFNLTDSTFLEAATILKAKQEAAAKTAADKAAANSKAKQEADAKAAAELKAQQEAEAKEAKAVMELKAKQEADAKAAAELKAKQEADAKAAADKAVADLKAKKEADAKALLDQLAAVLKAKQEKIAAAKKKTTITCIKGKITKKVTAVKPVCPKGYKKK